MSAPTYDKAYFIAKFEATDEDSWCVITLYAGDKSCAIGKCLRHATDFRESDALMDLFNCKGKFISYINDGRDPRYPQPTPKQRVLAALRDLP